MTVVSRFTKADLQKRFDECYEVRPEDNGCWRWVRTFTTGLKARAPMLYINDRGADGRPNKQEATPARRVIYWLKFGNFEPVQKVSSTCGNDWCVNPDHLELKGGSLSKKAKRVPRSEQGGEKQYNAKLTEEQVIQIRAGTLTSVTGVDMTTIYQARNGRSWKHLNDRYPPLIRGKITTGSDAEVIQKFNNSYIIDPKDKGCWRWTGTLVPTGDAVLSTKWDRYPTVGQGPAKYKLIPARRISYWIATGNLDPDLIVSQRCDNPWCVNPGHLYQSDFATRTEQRQRHEREARGEKHGRSKLTEEIVFKLRRGEMEADQATADSLGVSLPVLSNARSGRSWTYLNKTIMWEKKSKRGRPRKTPATSEG